MGSSEVSSKIARAISALLSCRGTRAFLPQVSYRVIRRERAHPGAQRTGQLALRRLLHQPGLGRRVRHRRRTAGLESDDVFRGCTGQGRAHDDALPGPPYCRLPRSPSLRVLRRWCNPGWAQARSKPSAPPRRIKGYGEMQGLIDTVRAEVALVSPKARGFSHQPSPIGLPDHRWGRDGNPTGLGTSCFVTLCLHEMGTCHCVGDNWRTGGDCGHRVLRGPDSLVAKFHPGTSCHRWSLPQAGGGRCLDRCRGIRGCRVTGSSLPPRRRSPGARVGVRVDG